jgi:hypothetical protein
MDASIIKVTAILLAFLPGLLSAKPAPGSAPRSGNHLFVWGGDITPKIHKDTIDNEHMKVAVSVGVWGYENKRYLHGIGNSLGFEGEWGENHQWFELRFFAERSIGLYYFGHGHSNPWSLLYSNIGGVSFGPILELSTKSWNAQGVGVKADIWHMIGPIGIQFDVRLLTSRLFDYTGGMMVRLPIPIYH